jgi:sec-independent protein translocase protein TatB
MSPHPPILLGTISMVDSVILMVMALVVFGPRRLPQIGRQIGKLMYEFRKASNDFKFQMEEELRQAEEADRRKKEEERQRSLAAVATSEQASVSADPAPQAQPADSPYPGEGTYPEQDPTQAGSPEAPAENSSPSIMPPAVGETIAAPRPNRAYAATPDPASESLRVEVSDSFQGEASAENSPAQENAKPSEADEALNPHG